MRTVTSCRSRTAAVAPMIVAVSLLAIPGNVQPGLQAADKGTGGPALLRTAQSGPWSAPATWEGKKVRPAGSRVQVRPGHTVTYDLQSDQVIRSIHVAGTLRFPPDKDTRLNVGLIKIQPGDDASEEGFDCDAHAQEPPAG